MTADTTTARETTVREALHAAVAPLTPPAPALVDGKPVPVRPLPRRDTPTVPTAAASEEDRGRLVGQAGKLRAAAALVEQAGPDVSLYITLHAYTNASIGALVTSPYARGLFGRERGHVEIAGMRVLAGLLGAPVTVAVYPDATHPLWLSCTGRFHGQMVDAYAHVADDPDLVAAAEQLAADTAARWDAGAGGAA